MLTMLSLKEKAAGDLLSLPQYMYVDMSGMMSTCAYARARRIGGTVCPRTVAIASEWTVNGAKKTMPVGICCFAHIMSRLTSAG